MEKEQVASSIHITIHECDNLDLEIERTKTSETLKDGRLATVDDLKELNFGTDDEYFPIYVSLLLTPDKNKSVLILC